MLTKEEFYTRTNYRMTYEEYKACYCPECPKMTTCCHASAYRRLPKIDGGLGLCKNLLK